MHAPRRPVEPATLRRVGVGSRPAVTPGARLEWTRTPAVAKKAPCTGHKSNRTRRQQAFSARAPVKRRNPSQQPSLPTLLARGRLASLWRRGMPPERRDRGLVQSQGQPRHHHALATWWPIAALAAVLAAAGGLLLGPRPASQATPGSIGSLLTSTAFAGAYQATYLHLRTAVDVASLQAVEERVFARLDTRSASSVLTYRDGEPWQPPSAIVDERTAWLALDAGATVVVNSAQGADRELEALAVSTTQALGIYADVNMYATPPSSAGLTAHHDHMDSIIVQASGRKRWLLCEPVGAGRTLPTRSTDVPGHPLYNRYDVSTLVVSGDCRNLTMEPGDLLYLPRGTPHAPVTEGASGSVHLTVGLLGDFTWEDYLKGLSIATPAQLDQQELPTLVQCFDRRALNTLVPHDALQTAALARLEVRVGNSGHVNTAASEVAAAERALGEALLGGFTELSSSGWISQPHSPPPSESQEHGSSATDPGGCGEETKAGRLRTGLLSCGARCSVEVGRLMLRLQQGEAQRRATEQRMLWADHSPAS